MLSPAKGQNCQTHLQRDESNVFLAMQVEAAVTTSQTHTSWDTMFTRDPEMDMGCLETAKLLYVWGLGNSLL